MSPGDGEVGRALLVLLESLAGELRREIGRSERLQADVDRLMAERGQLSRELAALRIAGLRKGKGRK